MGEDIKSQASGAAVGPPPPFNTTTRETECTGQAKHFDFSHREPVPADPFPAPRSPGQTLAVRLSQLSLRAAASGGRGASEQAEPDGYLAGSAHKLHKRELIWRSNGHCMPYRAILRTRSARTAQCGMAAESPQEDGARLIHDRPEDHWQRPPTAFSSAPIALPPHPPICILPV